jgi:hypothetical protein
VTHRRPLKDEEGLSSARREGRSTTHPHTLSHTIYSSSGLALRAFPRRKVREGPDRCYVDAS